ncbi:hypothetical protein [Amycolatopsis sp. YIM 10]|uniref:hypothetical protein n=1 Tax=Amycolatopsis sp. YIM 10 TaxID=2653857 RepID=UPI001290278F|nr:hypothetical protein [Amycolatopsis sp. YIM 10]
MSTETERLETASGDFLVALRANEGFQQDLYDALTAALRDCATAWEGADTLPRAAVGVLVDLVPATQGAAEAYPEPVKQQVYDASYELHDLITDAVEG